MKKIFQMLSSAILFAAVALPAAAQTFEVPASDQSKKIFIDTLFGPLVGGGGSEFSSVIALFNAAMLVLAGILVAYTLVAGTMSTAHDGEMLGKRWSSMWIPVRTSLGAAMIFPLSSGFCAIQYIVMWIAMQGIGFADKLVGAFMNQEYSSTAESFTPPSNYVARRQLLEKWLVAATCEESLNVYNKVVQSTSAARMLWDGYQAGNVGNVPGVDGKQYWYGMGMCGNVSIFNTGNETFAMDDSFISFDMEQFSDSMYQANVAQMESAKSQIEALGKKIAESGDNNEQLKIETAQTLDQLAQNWDTQVKSQAKSEYLAQMQRNGNRFKESVKSDGWLTFGGWYMEMARTQDGIARALSNIPSVSTSAYERVLDQERQMGNGLTGLFVNAFKNNTFDSEARASIKRANEFATYSTRSIGGQNALNSVEPSNVSAYLVKWFITPDYKSMFDDNKDFSQNPVIMAQNLGRNMVGWGTGGYVTGMALILFFDREILGNSTLKLSVLGPMLTAVAGTILVTGAFLSVYPPMLPYILWIGAILGWVIFLVEAIIAAPLWAVAKIAPDGDGVVGRGGQGYMLVLSLFLRPGLMVLGFIAAVIVMKPMGYLINSTFLGAFLSGASPSWYGVVTAIMGCILYAVLMVSVINRVFALIHVIPDKILRWMGGGGDNDLGSAAQGVEGTTMGKVVTGAGAANTLGQAGVSGAQNLRSMINNQNAHARSLREQRAQSDQQQTEQHRGEIGSSIEEANDGIRGMSSVGDTSSAGDTLYGLQRQKAENAMNKNSIHSMKGAISSANHAISKLEARGPMATAQEQNDAAAARSFLSDVGDMNPSDIGEVRGFMSANAGKYQGTSWGNILDRSQKENANVNQTISSLDQIRAQSKASQAPSGGNPDADPDGRDA